MSDYLDLRLELFRSSLNSAQSYFAIQGIRDLCMAIRKIGELFALVGHAAPSFTQDPDASIFNDLLMKANALREIDISQSVTLKWLHTHDLSEYFNLLKDEELRSRGAFLEAASDFPTAELSRTPPLVFSVMAIEDNRINFQKKVCKRIAKSADELLDLAGNKDPGRDVLRGVHDSAESLWFKLEAGEVCLDKKLLTEDISGPVEEVCNRLSEWNDLCLTLQSLDALHHGETGITFSDPAAYVIFRQILLEQSGDLIEAYKKSRKPFLKVLGKLKENL